jgi:hypothetical protein
MTIGIRRGCFLGRDGRCHGDDELDFQSDQLGSKPRQALGLTFGETVLDSQVRALDPTQFAEPLIEGCGQSLPLGRSA